MLVRRGLKAAEVVLAAELTVRVPEPLAEGLGPLETGEEGT